MTKTRAGLLSLGLLIAFICGGLSTSAPTIVATACTNQFVRSIAAATGAATCATVQNADLANSTIPINGVTCTLGTACATSSTKIISVVRDLTAATGNVAYTGMGFTPTSCTGFGAVGGAINYTTFFGMSDSSKTGRSLIGIQTTENVLTHFLGFYDSTGSNNQVADIASYDSDGFTLSWTKTGTPTGSANIYVMCTR